MRGAAPRRGRRGFGSPDPWDDTRRGALIGVVAFLAVQPRKGVVSASGAAVPAATAAVETASAAPTSKPSGDVAGSKSTVKAKESGASTKPPPPRKKPNWGF